MVKKLVFKFYYELIRTISRSGIARILLPLKVRKEVGRFLRQRVHAVTSLDSSRSYNVLGHRMWFLPKSRNIQGMVFGTYERDTVELFRKIVRPGMIFMDVGAYVGFYTLLVARLVGPGGRVYAFEPNPEAFRVLQRNVEENGYQDRVRAMPKAVSNSVKRVKLYVPDEKVGEASFYADERINAKDIEVKTIVLDEFLAGECCPKVHLVKIDVEGAEVEVLEGMRETIRRSPNMKLIIEFNPSNQMKAMGTCGRFFDTLLKLGFRRFYAIRHGLQTVQLPEGIDKLIQMTETTNFVNLLCER